MAPHKSARKDEATGEKVSRRQLKSDEDFIRILFRSGENRHAAGTDDPQTWRLDIKGRNVDTRESGA